MKNIKLAIFILTRKQNFYHKTAFVVINVKSILRAENPDPSKIRLK